VERAYPYLTHNLVRPDMTPVLVPDEAYDRALCGEWSNPYGVVRQGGPVSVKTPGESLAASLGAPEPPPRRGRKGAK
jgi:hypothetical protein